MMNRELLGPSLFLALFTLYAVVAWQIPLLPFEEYETVTSATLPKVYAAFGIVVCLLAIATTLLKPSEKEATDENLEKSHVLRTISLLVLMVIYSAMLEPVGFLISTSTFLLAGFFVMGERRKGILLFASIPVAVVFWFLMTQVLGIYLVPGDLWS
ncbi:MULTISPECIES: tripartite tricarboxylate transporter TctB family protein [Pseudoalteromonas]|jgi:putative tricarboxylic transport membrane protein|nr:MULTISPECIES: tripartite tricarboxylate transporter TctB family protein [Pseudoalteromonas]MBB1406291.1 tripartite tricarboxylate transporter TctB family protein [Pseudoalteromonas sp. SG44-5]MBH0071884.1 tripartite tricarboxylate transporter TctB family protein [Pseudoalteromonas sp. NZS127]MBH0093613.1 tripartite tricarboxylate transporter TctB family protein [Pseudoalteromonas sp. SCQQ13]SUC53643.1 Tripartite tricarboxylate transporter TctB family [Pseudoalteromonas nigrifaciens]GEN43549|tara:strand:- start:13210 stop:13677 length:468 start_codon:yes stop_codon:yes gene_type:complete